KGSAQTCPKLQREGSLRPKQRDDHPPVTQCPHQSKMGRQKYMHKLCQTGLLQLVRSSRGKSTADFRLTLRRGPLGGPTETMDNTSAMTYFRQVKTSLCVQ